MKPTTLAVFLAAFLNFGSSIQAETFYVSNTDGSPSYDGLHSSHRTGTEGPKATVQQGVDLAGASADAASTVEVVAGTYTLTTPLSLSSTHNGKTITLQPYDSGLVTLTGSSSRVISAASTQTSGSWLFKNLVLTNASAYEVIRNQNTHDVTYQFEGCTLSATNNTAARVLNNEAALGNSGYFWFHSCSITSQSYPLRLTARCGLKLTDTTLTSAAGAAVIICSGTHSSPRWVEVEGGTYTMDVGGFLILDSGTPCTDVIDHVLISDCTMHLAGRLINSTSVSTPWMSQYIDRWIMIGNTLTTSTSFGVFGPETEGGERECTFSYSSPSTGTFGKSGNKIAANAKIDVTWRENTVAKARRNVTVMSRTSTTIQVGGGTGDDYPETGASDWTLMQPTINDHPFVEMVWKGNTLICTNANPTHTICFMIGCDGMVWDNNRLICTAPTYATGYGGFVQKSAYTSFTNSLVVSGNKAATFKGASYLKCHNNTFYSRSGSAFDLQVHQDVGEDSDVPCLGYPISVDVRNNIFYSVDGPAATIGSAAYTLGTESPIFDCNLYYSGGPYSLTMAGSGIGMSGGIDAIKTAWAANMEQCEQSKTNDTHSVVADPRFRSVATLDFSLLGSSPCIDAGDNSALPADILTDLNGLARFFDDPVTADTGFGVPPIVDMGAFEYHTPAPGDFDLDGDVDADDLNTFLPCISGPTIPYADGCAMADLDGDEDVDQSDFGLLQGSFTGTGNPAGCGS